MYRAWIGSPTVYFPYAAYINQHLTNNSTTWNMDIVVQYDPFQGAIHAGKALLPTMTMPVSSVTASGCSPSPASGGTRTLQGVGGSEVTWNYTVSCPIPAPGTWGPTVDTKGQFAITTGSGPIVTTMDPSARQNVGCDQYRQNIGAACVLPMVDSEVTMDINSDIGEAAAGYLYWQIKLNGNPGYLGPYGYGVALEYDPGSTTLNRNAACEQAATPPGPWTSANRVDPEDQCDEYPFATTSNGAFQKAYGTQWGRCSVDGTQNETAGSRVGAVLRTDHIVPGDGFRVRINGTLPDMTNRCSR